MKIDRRSFLGLGLGAAAGMAVSPVGVKLIDDSSIWTQNWPWIPVPEDGKITYDRSVCSLCPGSCGISVRKIKERPVKIEGDADCPVTGGGACLHGIAGLQYLYDPSRVQTPLIRKGKRFKVVSWEEALATVAEKLGEIRNTAPDTLGLITGGTDNSVTAMFKRFLDAFGSPNAYAMPSLDYTLERTVTTLHGAGKTLGFDLEHSDFILSFGAGLLEGWGSPVACFKANAARRERHGKLYQIEPRLSNTAANADQWIPCNPGTEADLALGICALLLNKKLFTPGEFPGGLNRFTANVTQNALTGRLNKKGGVFVMTKDSYLKFPEVVMDDIAEAGAGKDKLAASLEGLMAKFNAAETSPLNALFVYNANPCYTMRDPKRVHAAIKKVPFVVSFSSYLDETAMAADVILPSHTFLERIEEVPSGGGLAKQVVSLARPMVTPIFDTKTPGDTVIALAQAMGGTLGESFGWESYETALEAVTEGIWDTLSETGYAILSENAPQGTPATNFAYMATMPKGVEAQGNGRLLLMPIDNMRLTSAIPAASPFAVKCVSDTVKRPGTYL